MSDHGVHYHQRTAARIGGGRVAGACEHCPWWVAENDYPDDREGQHLAAEDARTHLAAEHPEKVVYWDLL